MASGDGGPIGRRSSEQVAIDVAIRLGFLGLFAYFSLRLVQPFLLILLWAVILAVTFYPVFAWLRDHMGGRGKLAAAIVTLACLAVVLGPAAMLASSLVRTTEVLGGLASLEGLKLPPLPTALGDLPIYGEQIAAGWSLAASNLEDFLSRYAAIVLAAGEWLLRLIAGLAGGVLHILVAVVVSGFLYTPGARLVHGGRLFAGRVVGTRGSGFVDLAGATIRSVARGVIGVAIIQALLIGIGLLVAEVPAAGLLTLAALVLCIIQIGSGPVVVPVLIWAWFSLGTGMALFLTVYLIPVTLLDNVLKPLLLGKGLPTPALVIFAGVIGGTISYGLIGLFLGPIVLAVFYDLLVFWVRVGAPEAEAEPARAPGGIE